MKGVRYTTSAWTAHGHLLKWLVPGLVLSLGGTWVLFNQMVYSGTLLLSWTFAVPLGVACVALARSNVMDALQRQDVNC